MPIHSINPTLGTLVAERGWMEECAEVTLIYQQPSYASVVKNGLRLIYWTDRSDKYREVDVTRRVRPLFGLWGKPRDSKIVLAEVLEHVGVEATHSDNDFMIADGLIDEIKYAVRDDKYWMERCEDRRARRESARAFLTQFDLPENRNADVTGRNSDKEI